MDEGTGAAAAAVGTEQAGSVPAPAAALVATPALETPEATPAPQPQAPVAEDSKPTSKGVTYEKTGDVGLDMALEFVGQRGFGPDHPAIAAARAGDFSMIKAHLASQGAKAAGWEQFISLAEESFKRGQAAAAEKNGLITAAVQDAAGGPSNWDALRNWASANADQSERAEINAMLAAGPTQARACVQMLREAYAKSGLALAQEPAAVVKGSQVAHTASNPNESRRELVARLVAEHGAMGFIHSPEYKERARSGR